MMRVCVVSTLAKFHRICTSRNSTSMVVSEGDQEAMIAIGQTPSGQLPRS
jgi:hypothetical protein